jgi:hypothetical protein
LSSLQRVGRFASAGFILLAAGCQSSDSGGALNVGATADAKPKITEAELRAYCPQVTLREGTAFYNSYTPDGKDDPSKVVYQASISDVTRACTYGEGTLTLNVAVAGRVVPGPAVKDGTITMPIRVAVMQGEEVLYSQLNQFQVAVSAASGATQFVFNDPNITIPTPTARNIRVFAGYDEGPYDTD